MHWVTGGCIPRRACRQGLWGKKEAEMVVGGGKILPCHSCHFEPSVMEDSAAHEGTEPEALSWSHHMTGYTAGIAELRQVAS